MAETTTTITIDCHAYGILTPDGWQGYSHDGPCAIETCGRQYVTLEDDAVIDRAIEAVKAEQHDG